MAQELKEATAQIELSSASAAIALEIESNPQSQQWPMEQWEKWLTDNSFNIEQITNELSQHIDQHNNKHWSKNAYEDIKNALESNQTLEQLQSAIQEGKHPALEQLLRSVKNSQINNDKLLSTSGGGKGVRWIDHHPWGDAGIVATAATLATLGSIGYKKYQNRQNAGERADGIEQQLEQEAGENRGSARSLDSNLRPNDLQRWQNNEARNVRNNHDSSSSSSDDEIISEDFQHFIPDQNSNGGRLNIKRGPIRSARPNYTLEEYKRQFTSNELDLHPEQIARETAREWEITSRQTKNNIEDRASSDIKQGHKDTNKTIEKRPEPELELDPRLQGDLNRAYKEAKNNVLGRAQQVARDSDRDGKNIIRDSEQRVEASEDDAENAIEDVE